MERDINNDIKTIDHFKTEAIDIAIKFGPKILVAILILVVGSMVGGWLARASERGLTRLEMEPPVRLLLVRLLRIVVFMLFLILALQNLGVELLPLIAGLSIAGAGIALATQGVLSNVVAGLTIIFTKPYRVGEYIEIVGVQGLVQQISVFSTTLLHSDRSRVVVPNRKIVGEILHNYGQIRQAEIMVGVGYESDLPVALAGMRELVTANQRVLRDPAPLVQVVTLGENAVQIAVRPWVAVDDFGGVVDELSRAIIEDCRKRGVSIPFPQHEVRLIGADSK
ncbi:MAG TPA: mechanosensitive ion channel domain-containing protein [Steroidobacteraceae bacterium]|jgi:small conductance mechanosensitive channel|nr:mechanosensitive ion channel domain-containing protein [Steroidobacteraceae bacterium]